jgi:hypothetical protein
MPQAALMSQLRKSSRLVSQFHLDQSLTSFIDGAEHPVLPNSVIVLAQPGELIPTLAVAT